jgi:methyltransferase (TIGR00027 family)
MRKILGYTAYIIVQILFIPFGIIGAIIIYYKQMYVSKKLGVSSTAIEIINGRWIMDKFGLKKDSATVKLFNVLPNTTAIGQWFVLFPLYVLKIIAGENLIYPTFKEAPDATLANLVTSRTVFFDNILKKSLENSEQFVVMGAGLDTRCYGNLIKDNFKLYELDKKQIQELKRTYLQKANIDTSNVHFVDVDFSSEKWHKKLTAAGYDKNKVTTFLWEGVTLYLSEKDVRKTLSEIQQDAATGSTIVADFYSMDFVKGKLVPGKKALEITGEELQFGIDFEGNSSKELESLIESANMKLGQVYFMGAKTKKGTWMAVSEILI